MEFTISDDMLGTFVPIFVYWFYSGIYVLLGFFENYRLHSKTDEDEKNLVSKSTVVRGVLFQQFIQAIVAIILFKVSFLFSFISLPFLQFVIIVLPGFVNYCNEAHFWAWLLVKLALENFNWDCILLVDLGETLMWSSWNLLSLAALCGTRWL